MSEDIQHKALTDEETSQVSGGFPGKYILMQGTVIGVLPDTCFKVELENGHIVAADLSGKLRLAYTKIINGTKVTVKILPGDLTKGTIVDR